MRSNQPSTNQGIKLPARVYYVSCDQDSTVLVAMDVEIHDDLIRWFDTVKERMMYTDTVLDSNPDNFTFRRRNNEGGGIYKFVPMSLEIYNSQVKPRLLSPGNYSSEKEMITGFNETKKSTW